MRTHLPPTILLLLSSFNFNLTTAFPGLPLLPIPNTLLITPHSTPSTRNHPTGCHTPTSFFHTFLPFTASDSDSTNFTFAIRTRYTTYYPHALTTALRLDGFQPHALPVDEYCGWNKARSVRATSWVETGWHRGDVFWKHADLRWVGVEPSADPQFDFGSGERIVAHWAADTEAHVPPHREGRPGNETLERIVKVLREEEPAADVYSVATVVLSYFVSLFGFLLLLVGLSYYTGRRGDECEEGEEEGEEMVNVGGKREGTGDGSEEGERTESEGSGVETPLPIYSVDGAGR